MLSRCFLDFSVGVRASVIGLSQISSFFSQKDFRNFVFSFSIFYLHIKIGKKIGQKFNNIKCALSLKDI